MFPSRRVASVVFLFAFVVGGCREFGRDGKAATTAPGGGTVVVVPGGAQVTKLSFWAGASADLGEAARSASGAVFPLLAYRRFCGVEHPDEFGLAPPRLGVAIRGPDGRPGSLLVGAVNFTGGGTYVLEGDSPCVDLVTTSSILRLARLAGEEAAAPFQPPPQAGRPGEGPRPDPGPAEPWVEQVRREQARKGTATSGGRPG